MPNKEQFLQAFAEQMEPAMKKEQVEHLKVIQLSTQLIMFKINLFKRRELLWKKQSINKVSGQF